MSFRNAIFIVAFCVLLLLVAGCKKSDKDYWAEGKSRLDVSACDKIVNESIRDDCYARVAVGRKNVSVCEGIEHFYVRSKCLESA